MGKLFDNPWTVIILVILVVLLFGASKLPGLARSLGQSMRIFKSEVKQMKDDGKTGSNPSEEDSSPVEGRVVDRSGMRESRREEPMRRSSGTPTDAGHAGGKTPEDTP